LTRSLYLLVLSVLQLLVVAGCGSSPSKGDANGAQLDLGTQRPDALVGCSSAADCASGEVCAGPGIAYCQPGAGHGQACEDDEHCLSGLCTAEGVCCDRACDAPCETCINKAACGLRAAGTACGGSGTCHNPEGTETSTFEAPRCDGKTSSCGGLSQSEDCAAFRCSEGGCLQRCERHADCRSGLCALWSTPRSCVSEGAVCYVDAKAAAGGDGTAAKPYQRVAECLAREASMIVVEPGSYSGDQVLDYDVTIVGRGAGTLKQPELLVAPKVELLARSSGLLISRGKVVRLGGLGLVAEGWPGYTGDLLTAVGAAVSGTSSALELDQVRIKGGQRNTLKADSVVLRDVYSEGGCLYVTAPDGTVTVERVRVSQTFPIGLAIDAPRGKLSLRDVLVDIAEGGLTILGDVTFEATNVRVRSAAFSGVQVGASCRGRFVNLVAPGSSGLIIGEGTEIDVIHATLSTPVWNRALECPESATVRVINSIVWSSEEPVSRGPCIFINSHVGAGSAKDPLFEGGYGSTRFELSSASPCVDVAADAIPNVALPMTDVLGRPRRVQLRQHAWSRGDLGAYERQQP
jgi:hypothetical protein